MKEKKKNKIGIVGLSALVFILLSIAIYQQTIISQSPNYLPPSSWISNSNIYLHPDFTSTPTFWEAKIVIQNFEGNQNNSIGKIFFRDSGDTESMEPTMFGGNKLIVLNITDKDLIMPGDIIGFKVENRTIVHRVVEKSYVYHENTYEPVFRTKGDNLARMDPWIIKSDDIVGVVVGILY